MRGALHGILTLKAKLTSTSPMLLHFMGTFLEPV